MADVNHPRLEHEKARARTTSALTFGSASLHSPLHFMSSGALQSTPSEKNRAWPPPAPGLAAGPTVRSRRGTLVVVNETRRPDFCVSNVKRRKIDLGASPVADEEPSRVSRETRAPLGSRLHS